VDVTFDPAKDAENIRKHGISLKRAEDFDIATETSISTTARTMAKFVGTLSGFWTLDSIA
jgi:uncharacterized DUF497 family protein